MAVDMPESHDLTVWMMALVAQAERQVISRRRKDALASAKAHEIKLGNPNGAEAFRHEQKGREVLRSVVSAIVYTS